jgi:hypothetical protein
MTPAQLRTRMISALVPARFASDGVFDCPLCGGKGDLHLTVYDNKPSTYLFNLACFSASALPRMAGRRPEELRRRQTAWAAGATHPRRFSFPKRCPRRAPFAEAR